MQIEITQTSPTSRHLDEMINLNTLRLEIMDHIQELKNKTKQQLSRKLLKYLLFCSINGGCVLHCFSMECHCYQHCEVAERAFKAYAHIAKRNCYRSELHSSILIFCVLCNHIKADYSTVKVIEWCSKMTSEGGSRKLFCTMHQFRRSVHVDEVCLTCHSHVLFWFACHL